MAAKRGRPADPGTEARSVALFELMKSGNTIDELAQLMRVSRQRVHQLLDRLPEYHKWRDEQKRSREDRAVEWLERWRKGESMIEIGNADGVHSSLVQHSIKALPDYEFVRRTRHKRPRFKDPEKCQAMLDMYLKGHTLTEVGKAFGYTGANPSSPVRMMIGRMPGYPGRNPRPLNKR